VHDREPLHLHDLAFRRTQKFTRHTGEGRCPWQIWSPALAGKTRRGGSRGTIRIHLSTSRTALALSERVRGPLGLRSAQHSSVVA
jgi:hypothetical protein